MRPYVAFLDQTEETHSLIVQTYFCCQHSAFIVHTKAQEIKPEFKKCLFLFLPPPCLALCVMIGEFSTMSDLIPDKCRFVHYCLPYRWQIYNGITWNDLAMMEEIEKAYCDPATSRYSDAGLLA